MGLWNQAIQEMMEFPEVVFVGAKIAGIYIYRCTDDLNVLAMDWGSRNISTTIEFSAELDL